MAKTIMLARSILYNNKHRQLFNTTSTSRLETFDHCDAPPIGLVSGHSNTATAASQQRPSQPPQSSSSYTEAMTLAMESLALAEDITTGRDCHFDSLYSASMFHCDPELWAQIGVCGAGLEHNYSCPSELINTPPVSPLTPKLFRNDLSNKLKKNSTFALAADEKFGKSKFQPNYDSSGSSSGEDLYYLGEYSKKNLAQGNDNHNHNNNSSIVENDQKSKSKLCEQPNDLNEVAEKELYFLGEYAAGNQTQQQQPIPTTIKLVSTTNGFNGGGGGRYRVVVVVENPKSLSMMVGTDGLGIISRKRQDRRRNQRPGESDEQYRRRLLSLERQLITARTKRGHDQSFSSTDTESTAISLEQNCDAEAKTKPKKQQQQRRRTNKETITTEDHQVEEGGSLLNSSSRNLKTAKRSKPSNSSSSSSSTNRPPMTRAQVEERRRQGRVYYYESMKRKHPEKYLAVMEKRAKREQKRQLQQQQKKSLSSPSTSSQSLSNRNSSNPQKRRRQQR